MINLNAVADWIQSNVLYVLFIVAAASVAVGAINKKVRDAMLTAGLLVVCLLVVVIAKNIDGITAWLGTFFS